MDYLKKRSRDNARAPMQWSTDYMAGFTSGQPWLKVNPNYIYINVEQSLKDEDSILNFYKKLIMLRKENKTLIYGTFREIYKESEQIGGYVRNLENESFLVLCNFTESQVKIEDIDDKYIVLSNIKSHEKGRLKAFETVVCKFSKEYSMKFE